MSIAMVLPEDGKVVGCDVSEDYADIGRPFWKKVSSFFLSLTIQT